MSIGGLDVNCVNVSIINVLINRSNLMWTEKIDSKNQRDQKFVKLKFWIKSCEISDLFLEIDPNQNLYINIYFYS